MTVATAFAVAPPTHTHTHTHATLRFSAAQIRKLDYLDAVVTVVAIFDVFFGEDSVIGGGEVCRPRPQQSIDESSLVALRAFSLLRVVRLFANWRTLQALMLLIYDSATELLSFLVLMLIFVYMSSLLGLQLFSNKFHFDADGCVLPRCCLLLPGGWLAGCCSTVS